jgi:hypothetical protein
MIFIRAVEYGEQIIIVWKVVVVALGRCWFQERYSGGE